MNQQRGVQQQQWSNRQIRRRNRSDGAQNQQQQQQQQNVTRDTVQNQQNASTSSAAGNSTGGRANGNNKKPPRKDEQKLLEQQQQQKQNSKKARRKEKKEKKNSLQTRVNEALWNCAEGDELKTLAQILQPDNDFLYRIYMSVRRDLSDVIRKKSAYFDIHPFGSTISGLAFKDSDFDLFIELPNTNEPVNRVIHALIAIMRRLKKFDQIVPIVHARVPIIKCVHIETGYNCDISFNNNLGVQNSHIIRHLVTFDYRIHPLTIILKYWFRTHDISGSGRITNYCLFNLIIFYLQSIPFPILPPIAVFQARIPENIVGFWNIAFNFNLPNQTRNQLKVAELLLGFFTFYRDFDFQTNMICPLYGRSYDRMDFNQNIPREFKRYSDYMKSQDAQELTVGRTMCVQDPYNLSFNMAACCWPNTFNLFMHEISNAATICQTELAAGLESAKFLHRLFNDRAKVPNPHPQVNLVADKNSGPFECNIVPIEYELSIVRAVLAKLATAGSTIETIQVKQHWADKAIEFLREVFERFFVFKLEAVVEQVKVKKSPKLLGQSDVHSNKYNQKFIVIATHDVYLYRKIRKDIGVDYIELEAAGSAAEVESKPSLIDMRCSMTISTTNKFDHLRIVFFDETTIEQKQKTTKQKCMKNLFQSFTRTIRNHLRAYFMKYQRDILMENGSSAAVSS